MRGEIAVIKGDGIGPEVIEEAVRILKKVERLYSHSFSLTYVEAGGASIDKYGVPLIDEEKEKAKNADAVLLGAVGGEKWDSLPSELRPERALLELRSSLGLFCNLRPVRIYPSLSSSSPLKESILNNGLDILIVRELTGGIYFGKRGREKEEAFDEMRYSKDEIKRIAEKAFETAEIRKKHLTVVDKANVLETSRLWREVVKEVKEGHKGVECDFMYVDNAAMQIVRNPSFFDVILTENMFGDILSDEAAALTGSIGLLPSASLGEEKRGMYEPIHGSAPDIAGENIANPTATILSLALLLRYSFSLRKEAESIERAVYEALEDGMRTKDISSASSFISTKEAGEEIERRIK